LENLGKFRGGFALQVLDLTGKFADRSTGFGVYRFETRLQAFERAGILRGLALRGAQSLDVGFEGPDILGHFLRHAEQLATLSALLGCDSPCGRRLQRVKRRLT